ncbi:hypothetical protein M758_6G084800 [Ceratodon purpureus]|nr:hypothetical protein M758_6G084800 [Ceratodon purpureus]
MSSLVFSNTFKAGPLYFGVSDLKMHITEPKSRYVQNLVGRQSMETTMYERSPINHLDKLTCPIILFHGQQDKVIRRFDPLSPG